MSFVCLVPANDFKDQIPRGPLPDLTGNRKHEVHQVVNPGLPPSEFDVFFSQNNISLSWHICLMYLLNWTNHASKSTLFALNGLLVIQKHIKLSMILIEKRLNTYYR